MRDRGLAMSGSAGSTASPGSDEALAQGWDGTSCPTADQRKAIGRLDGKFPDDSLEAISANQEGECCYHVIPDCPGGRPFLVHGRARVAALRGSVELNGDSASQAEEWLGDALAEHASIGAFARLTLQLLALGAPAELIKDAQLASLDELRHAAFCFEMASRYAGNPLAPGPLPVQGALDDLSLVSLIEHNLREGCIGETLAARHVERRAEQARDPEVRRTLLAISEDELRHAELAFRILGWCREVAPDQTREAIERILSEGSPPEPSATTPETWRHVLRPLFVALAA